MDDTHQSKMFSCSIIAEQIRSIPTRSRSHETSLQATTKRKKGYHGNHCLLLFMLLVCNINYLVRNISNQIEMNYFSCNIV